MKNLSEIFDNNLILYHCSFRGKDKKIQKDGLKKNSYVVDKLQGAYAFDYIQDSHNNPIYQITCNAKDLKLDKDWENFKSFYKSGIQLTLQEKQYFNWIGALKENKFNPWKINLYQIIKPIKNVKIIKNKNNFIGKYLNEKGCFECFKYFGECYNKNIYNYILLDEKNIGNIIYYSNRDSYIFQTYYSFTNEIFEKEFFINKGWNKNKILNFLIKKYEAKFI